MTKILFFTFILSALGACSHSSKKFDRNTAAVDSPKESYSVSFDKGSTPVSVKNAKITVDIEKCVQKGEDDTYLENRFLCDLDLGENIYFLLLANPESIKKNQDSYCIINFDGNRLHLENSSSNNEAKNKTTAVSKITKCLEDSSIFEHVDPDKPSNIFETLDPIFYLSW